MPAIGQTISHYRITGNLGKSGVGEVLVFLADDTILGRKVALKFSPDAFTSDPERIVRFDWEAKRLDSLKHSNIDGINGPEQADEIRILVLEHLEAKKLQAWKRLLTITKHIHLSGFFKIVAIVNAE